MVFGPLSETELFMIYHFIFSRPSSCDTLAFVLVIAPVCNNFAIHLFLQTESDEERGAARGSSHRPELESQHASQLETIDDNVSGNHRQGEVSHYVS